MASNDSSTKGEPLTDRRQFRRYITPDRLRAGFIGADLRIAGEVHEIGLEGLFIATKEPVAVGMVGKFGVKFPNWFFRANAIVRHVFPGRGFGIEFLSMSTLDRQELGSYYGALRRAAQHGQEQDPSGTTL